MSGRFPALDSAADQETRDAMHAYARILGAWLENARTRRKHWWHISLRPSLPGLSTGVIRANPDFELELDFIGSRLIVRTPEQTVTSNLFGQPAAELAAFIDKTLSKAGVDSGLAPGEDVRGEQRFGEYDSQRSVALHGAFSSIASSMEQFRAGIREETSPIQVWPHHFDLSMIWLPGDKVPDQDPANEEHADKQMNFGFVLGDANIDEAYLYITAYPQPDLLPSVALPDGTTWTNEGFSGALLLYRDLIATSNPDAYLQKLWSGLLEAGQRYL